MPISLFQQFGTNAKLSGQIQVTLVNLADCHGDSNILAAMSWTAGGGNYHFATTGNSSGFSAAIARISSVIFIEQYFEPHMLQKWAFIQVFRLHHLRQLILPSLQLPFVRLSRLDDPTRFQNSS